MRRRPSGGTNTSDATATKYQIAADETAYGSGGKITGVYPIIKPLGIAILNVVFRESPEIIKGVFTV